MDRHRKERFIAVTFHPTWVTETNRDAIPFLSPQPCLGHHLPPKSWASQSLTASGLRVWRGTRKRTTWTTSPPWLRGQSIFGNPTDYLGQVLRGLGRACPWRP